MKIDKLGQYRVVDLSMHIDPSTSTRTCRIKRIFQDSTRDYHSEITVESHLGTHIETPYHYKDEWKDIVDLPATAFMGRGVLFHLKCEPCSPITKKMLDEVDKGRVNTGDVCILTSPYHCIPFSNDPDDKRPYLCRESGEWFLDKKVKCVGFGDGVAIEHSVEDACAVHEVLMPHDIMFLEVMQNIEKLSSNIFLIIYQPMPIKGLDSCCVRAVAIEGVPGFC